MSKTTPEHLSETYIRQRIDRVDDDILAGWEQYYRTFAIDSIATCLKFVKRSVGEIPKKIGDFATHVRPVQDPILQSSELSRYTRLSDI